MSLKLQEYDEGRTVEVNLSGKLTKTDYRDFVPELDRLIKLHGKIQLLVEMSDFHGWDPAALWQDLKFDLKHFTHLERVAMVGEKRWQRAMAQFCRPFTTADIHYFNRSNKDDARKWLGLVETVPTALS